MEPRALTLDQVVYARERVMFTVMVIVSVFVYGGLVVFAYADAASGGVILFYGVILSLAAFLAHAFALGRIRGNGVLVHERQFPDLHQLIAAHAARLGLASTPTAYVLESGGVMNAFATKLMGDRKSVV